MKLDVNALRYLSRDESRTLQAVEIGQKNHDIVPVPLVDSIAGLKHGGVVRCLKALLRQKLVHHDNTRYDGYRLTPLGYDFLALRALVARGAITAVGRQIGVGKESDVFEVLNAEGEVLAMKLHRLGRTSFRAVKKKRDYLQHRNSFSWLWLSRLAAAKEFAFMEALGVAGFPVPHAIEHNRHAVLMSLVDAVPLVQVRLADPGAVYLQLMDMIADLAARGLVHCDFNEFNILVDEQGAVTLIDFPQMVSTSHANAEELFERDVDCIVRFFTKKLGYVPEQDTSLPYMRPDFKAATASASEKLDVQLSASGFKKEHLSALDSYVSALQGMVAPRDGSSSGEEEESDSDSEPEGCDSSDEAGSSGGEGDESEKGEVP
ncbi:hypothetical protein WJX75_009355 [Coccomyxa subellipsoidea]|uniref:non-specific serine/threonine protein kinase n=1 Tax=Coccomyxa subellipsoidea TaxID=248742 RepID=A0ABR2YDL1_9CHLO